MSDKVTTMDPTIEVPEQVGTEQTGAGDVARTSSDLPKLDQIMARICRDACQDSMRYAVRSDVGLDGE